jgi:hypothetical protein
MSPAPDEVARIEHELDILRSRYAIFQRWARITKWYCIGIAVTVPAALIWYAMRYVVAFDPFIAGFMIIATLLVCAGLYLARDRNWRWIDAVSPPPGWPRAPGFGPWKGPQSEAIAIEAMIAEREARLAALKRRPA